MNENESLVAPDEKGQSWRKAKSTHFATYEEAKAAFDKVNALRTRIRKREQGFDLVQYELLVGKQ